MEQDKTLLLQLGERVKALRVTRGRSQEELAERAGMSLKHLGEIERAMCEPPQDTRAWTRAHLLRLAGDERIDQVHWDRVRVRTQAPDSVGPRVRTVHLPVPFAATRATHERHFAAAATLESIVDALQEAEEQRLIPGGAKP